MTLIEFNPSAGRSPFQALLDAGLLADAREAFPVAMRTNGFPISPPMENAYLLAANTIVKYCNDQRAQIHGILTLTAELENYMEPMRILLRHGEEYLEENGRPARIDETALIAALCYAPLTEHDIDLEREEEIARLIGDEPLDLFQHSHAYVASGYDPDYFHYLGGQDMGNVAQAIYLAISVKVLNTSIREIETCLREGRTIPMHDIDTYIAQYTGASNLPLYGDSALENEYAHQVERMKKALNAALPETPGCIPFPGQEHFSP